MKKDPLIDAIEDWSGHSDARTALREFYVWGILMPLLTAAAAIWLLTGCMTASGNEKTGEWKTAAVGTDASRYKVTSKGMDVTGMNQSTSLSKLADTVRTMFTNALVAEGLKFSLGKYYDHQNNVVNNARTIQLEKLRNAKSEADAKSAFETLKLNRATEAAAGAGTTTTGGTFDPTTGLNVL